jgi:hypothetical protein
VVIDGGHYTLIRARPGEFVSVVDEFLASSS